MHVCGSELQTLKTRSHIIGSNENISWLDLEAAASARNNKKKKNPKKKHKWKEMLWEWNENIIRRRASWCWLTLYTSHRSQAPTPHRNSLDALHQLMKNIFALFFFISLTKYGNSSISHFGMALEPRLRLRSHVLFVVVDEREGEAEPLIENFFLGRLFAVCRLRNDSWKI